MDSWSDATPTSSASGPGSSLRAMTLGEILDGMFRLFIAHWRVFLLAVGSILVAANIAQGWLATEAVGVSLGDLFGTPEAALGGVGGSSSAQRWLDISQGVFLLVVTPFTMAAACLISSEGHEGRTPTAGGVWRRTLSRFWALLGLTLLLVIVGVVTVIVLRLLSGVAAAIGSSAGLVVYFVLSLFALASISTLLCMTFPALMVEGLGPVLAIRRSLELIRGRFWRTLGTLILVLIIVIVIFFVIFFGLTLPTQYGFDSRGVVALAFIGATIAQVLTLPLTTNAVTLLYYDARVRDEGYDLELRTRDDDAGSAPLPGQPFG